MCYAAPALAAAKALKPTIKRSQAEERMMADCDAFAGHLRRLDKGARQFEKDTAGE
jgi:hypothetical protein